MFPLVKNPESIHQHHLGVKAHRLLHLTNGITAFGGNSNIFSIEGKGPLSPAYQFYNSYFDQLPQSF